MSRDEREDSCEKVQENETDCEPVIHFTCVNVFFDAAQFAFEFGPDGRHVRRDGFDGEDRIALAEIGVTQLVEREAARRSSGRSAGMLKVGPVRNFVNDDPTILSRFVPETVK